MSALMLSIFAGALSATSRVPIEVVDVSSVGELADGLESSPFGITRDGCFVVFLSDGTNLVAGDMNGLYDAFVHDCRTGVTERVSVATDGTESNTNVGSAAITDNGRFVTFRGGDSLLAGAPSTGDFIFVRDRWTGRTEVVSIVGGLPEVSDRGITSESGRFVAFSCSSGVCLRDRLHRTTVAIVSEGTISDGPRAMSGNGRFIALATPLPLDASDTNGLRDAYIWDRLTGRFARASVLNDGTQTTSDVAQVSISLNGRFIAFMAQFDDQPCCSLFIYDQLSHRTIAVPGSGASSGPSVANRCQLAFETGSAFDPRDTNGHVDAYVWSCVSGRFTWASRSVDNQPGDGGSGNPVIASNGRHVAFGSDSTDLVGVPLNGSLHAFVRHL
jgi:hypothetical protein